jgi:hypothetical protein
MSASAVPPGGGLASNVSTMIASVLKLIGVRLSMAVMELADARDGADGVEIFRAHMFDVFPLGDRKH